MVIEPIPSATVECLGNGGVKLTLVAADGTVLGEPQFVCNGAQGEPGIPGVQGVQGVQGPTGPAGPSAAFRMYTFNVPAGSIMATPRALFSFPVTVPSAGVVLASATGYCQFDPANPATVHFEFSQTNAGTQVPPALQSPLPNVAIFSSAPEESPAYRSFAFSRTFNVAGGSVSPAILLNLQRLAGTVSPTCNMAVTLAFTASLLPQ